MMPSTAITSIWMWLHDWKMWARVDGVSTEVEDGVTGFLLGGKLPIMLNTFRPDAHEIADKLAVLLADGDLRGTMGKAGRVKFEREFTLQVFERRMTGILSGITNPLGLSD